MQDWCSWMLLIPDWPDKPVAFKPIITNTFKFWGQTSNLIHYIRWVIVIHLIAHCLSNQAHNFPIILCAFRKRKNLFKFSYSSLCVGKCAFFFKKASSRKYDISKIGSLCHKYILNHKKFKFLKCLGYKITICIGCGWVVADYIHRFQFPSICCSVHLWFF